jgi:hypothetical protein
MNTTETHSPEPRTSRTRDQNFTAKVKHSTPVFYNLDVSNPSPSEHKTLGLCLCRRPNNDCLQMNWRRREITSVALHTAESCRLSRELLLHAKAHMYYHCALRVKSAVCLFY